MFNTERLGIAKGTEPMNVIFFEDKTCTKAKENSDLNLALYPFFSIYSYSSSCG